MIRILLLLSLALHFSIVGTYAQEGKKTTFEPTLRYVGEVANNFSGGSKKSVQYMGLATAGVTFNTEPARWWRGGTFYLGVISTHGKGISSTSLHDRQSISNLEVGNHPLLFSGVWYHQQVGRVGIRGGLMELSNDFLIQPYLESFSCASFGFLPTLGGNYSLPNYPVAGLGVSASWAINERWSFTTALYNGAVSDLDKDKYNVKWRANVARDGVLSVSELRYAAPEESDDLGFSYTLGGAYHNKSFPSVSDNSRMIENNFALYALAEHDVYKSIKKRVGLFAQFSLAPMDRNDVYAYTSIGVFANGLLTASHSDRIGVALCQYHCREETESGSMKKEMENTMEIFFRYDINKYIGIKPTFSTIFSTNRPTATAGMIRMYVNIF